MRQSLRLTLAAALLATASGLASADEYRATAEDTPSAGAMGFDLLIVRPLGLVATVLGTGLFVLQLPLSLIQGEPPMDPAKALVVEPAQFTFMRPLGQMN